jgi:hypothetical protein
MKVGNILSTYIQSGGYFGDIRISTKESRSIRICITGTNLDRTVVRIKIACGAIFPTVNSTER